MQEKLESAKLRVLRALYPTFPTYLVRYVLSCLTCLVPYVLLCPTCLVPYVLSCLTCFALYLPRSLCGLVPRTFFPMHPAVSYIAYSNSPLVLLSFNASRSYFYIYLLIVIFFSGNLLQLKQIQFANNTLKRRSVFINIMIYLNYLKPNTKT